MPEAFLKGNGAVIKVVIDNQSDLDAHVAKVISTGFAPATEEEYNAFVGATSTPAVEAPVEVASEDTQDDEVTTEAESVVEAPVEEVVNPIE